MNRLNLTLVHAAALGLSVDLQACMKARALLGKRRHETEHIPALPYAEAPKFFQWLCTLDTTASQVLHFLMLQRSRYMTLESVVGLSDNSAITLPNMAA